MNFTGITPNKTHFQRIRSFRRFPSDFSGFSSIFNEFEDIRDGFDEFENGHEEIGNGFSSFDPPLPLAPPQPPLPLVYEEADTYVKPFWNCTSTVSRFSASGCADFLTFLPPHFYEDMVFDVKPKRDSVSEFSAFPSENSSNYTILAGKEEGESRAQGRRKAAKLEVEDIQKYFDLSISRAAKEMNVGITLLKRRCIELNIMRWPHRKIKSLKTLIKFVENRAKSIEIERGKQRKLWIPATKAKKN